jgi:hypothetical protein
MAKRAHTPEQTIQSERHAEIELTADDGSPVDANRLGRRDPTGRTRRCDQELTEVVVLSNNPLARPGFQRSPNA